MSKAQRTFTWFLHLWILIIIMFWILQAEDVCICPERTVTFVDWMVIFGCIIIFARIRLSDTLLWCSQSGQSWNVTMSHDHMSEATKEISLKCFGKKSASMDSVGQYLMSMSSFDATSLTQKYLMSMCLEHCPAEACPLSSSFLVLLLSW